MGFFDKFLKSRNTEDENDMFTDELLKMTGRTQENSEDVHENISSSDENLSKSDAPKVFNCSEPELMSEQTDESILSEQFLSIQPIEYERNNDICNRFVMSAITEYENGCFDRAALAELSYDELCHVYNTVDWYVCNMGCDLKDEAVRYKRYLRGVILGRLRSMTTYTVTSPETSLPLSVGDGTMTLFTDRALAERLIEAGEKAGISVCEINPDNFNTAFCRYYTTGFSRVKLNVKSTVSLCDIYEILPGENCGSTCRQACAEMIAYRQTLAAVQRKAENEGMGIADEDKKHLLRLSLTAALTLIKSTLLLPASGEGEEQSIFVPVVTLSDTSKYVALFTDADALYTYYKKTVANAAIPHLVRERYIEIAHNEAIRGIVVNPGREEYIMTKRMLSQMFSEA